ncbi:MAG TPA: transglutaminase-like cysteine peptidase [Alphaproteobacteria bacterium]|nr:transglutaminase-like cysteine peptidase [Alphaproteobacteria bacterium]
MALAAAALALGLLLPPPALALESESLFGSTGVRMEGTNLRMLLPQWASVIDRMNQTKEPFDPNCEDPRLSFCALQKWTPFLSSLKGLDELTQLKRVNDFMNSVPYLVDAVWETPLEFMRRFGMCRDYAVAKYWSLRYLGWPSERLRIVVLDILDMPDGHTGRPTSHAVLVVHMPSQDLVLDNLHKGFLVDAKSIVDYRPVYAVTEHAFWLFRRG